MERMGNLAFSSSKPHFFQPIHADSSSADQLKVKLNDFKFTDGWPEFYKAHELSTEYFLAFQYQGHDFIFRVWVFDLIEVDSEESHADADDELEEVSEDDATRISKYPHFIATLKSYNIGRSFLTIPTKFAKLNIPDDVETVVLIDEERKEWPIKLTRRSDGYGVHFGFGWKDFQSEKRLKKGDICLFEQENEDKLAFTVSIIREI
ncbi:hypothetical protein MKW98_003972 [Papaver atlanticum]|uniref:TF-B3 domain-containing protein n=1 Tax=Papaver atlanticum TaxID=357466 RepID=A0AAD4XHQ2_9MAGN|nr:hypothetical protein MKW98_003972 [Papaver atlanticum]